jgi:hypothetical protein
VKTTEIKRKKTNISINDIEDNFDKSCMYNENIRKAATFMDFSVILNKKVEDNEFNYGNKTNLDATCNGFNNWDISCINKD